MLATIHDPAVTREILAHLGVPDSGESPGPAPAEPNAVAPAPRREACSALIRPVHLPVDGGGAPA